jgi:hypothetical protein
MTPVSSKCRVSAPWAMGCAMQRQSWQDLEGVGLVALDRQPTLPPHILLRGGRLVFEAAAAFGQPMLVGEGLADRVCSMAAGWTGCRGGQV